MKQHVNNVARSCFFQLRCIRRLWRCIDHNTVMQLGCSHVLSRLDYCNIVLSVLQKSTISILQHVQNSAAWLDADLWPHDHITQALIDLHWLPVEFCVKYNVCLLMQMVHTGQCPSYLADTVVPKVVSNSCTGLRSGNNDTFNRTSVISTAIICNIFWYTELLKVCTCSSDQQDHLSSPITKFCIFYLVPVSLLLFHYFLLPFSFRN